MTSWTPCAAAGPTGFDLDRAVLVSTDVLDRDGGRWTSRATATPWRESLWRTGDGHHVVGLHRGGDAAGGHGVDRWRWVSGALAEDWLRRQGLAGTADAAFPPRADRPCPPLLVGLEHHHRVRLEQARADDDVSLEHVLRDAVEQYLAGHREPTPTRPPWWPVGVVRDSVGVPACSPRAAASGPRGADRV